MEIDKETYKTMLEKLLELDYDEDNLKWYERELKKLKEIK